MIDRQGAGAWQPSTERIQRIKEMDLTAADFAAFTGANAGFRPASPDIWMMFWKEDVCEKDQFHTWFPHLPLLDAQRMWLAMEEHFLSRYDEFLRVWPEWGSSGIWSVPYPGSRRAGGMVDYKYLPLPGELVERFEAWQAEYSNSPPCGPIEPDWDRFDEVADGLARDLKQCVGPRIYVERRELVEVLMDGTTRSCRPLLGLPESD